MKKIIVLLVSLFCLISPAFAGNLLQQQDEVKFVQNLVNKPAFPVTSSKLELIKEDYWVYTQGGDCLYSDLVKNLKKLSANKSSENEINIKYLTLLKNKIDTIVKIQNISIDNNLRLKAVNKKIIIEDNDYKKLSKETKELITGFNVILFE